MSALRTYRTAAELAGALRTLGYAGGAPHRVTDHSRRVDAELCAELSCANCGFPGLCYMPFHGPRGEYKAVAACPDCGCGHPV